MRNDDDANARLLLRLMGAMALKMPIVPDYNCKAWLENPKYLQEFLESLQDGPRAHHWVESRMVVVTIHPKRSFEEWVEACAGAHADVQLVSGNFRRALTIYEHVTKPYRQAVVLFRAPRHGLSREQLVRLRKRMDLLPTGFEHLAAIGEQYPVFLDYGQSVATIDTFMQGIGQPWYPLLFKNELSNESGYNVLRLQGFDQDASSWYIGLSPHSLC